MEKRDLGLDTAKAIASIFVLMLHLQPIQSSSLSANALMQFFWNHIFIVAVPLFYIVSLVILFEKAQKTYVKKRVGKLLDLFLFWSGVNLLFSLYSNYLPISEIDFSFVDYVLKTSIFYFLFDLLLLTIFTYYWLKVSDYYRKLLSPFLILLFTIYFCFNGNIPLQRIDNFLVYIPIVNILRGIEVKWYHAYSALLVWGSFTTFELLSLIPSSNIYGRVSIAAGALFVYFSTRFLKPGLLEPCAKYSLGIYAIHLYARTIALRFLPYSTDSILGLQIAPIYIFAATLLLTFTIIILLEKTPLKRYIR